ncbi:MAG: hypothetical protein HC803_09235 [Saprospiraceae bacterium]|nr:hypothetical protein [Saprospiraceae bacterium]
MHKPKTEMTIETRDGNIYVGIIVSETDELVKMIIGGRDIIHIQQSNILTKTTFKSQGRMHTISLDFLIIMNVGKVSFCFKL